MIKIKTKLRRSHTFLNADHIVSVAFDEGRKTLFIRTSDGERLNVDFESDEAALEALDVIYGGSYRILEGQTGTGGPYDVKRL